MYRGYLIRLWALPRDSGRCKWCGQPIVWGTTDRGKPLPLTPGVAVLRQETDPTTGAVFDIVARDACHVATCPGPRRPLLEVADRG